MQWLRYMDGDGDYVLINLDRVSAISIGGEIPHRVQLEGDDIFAVIDQVDVIEVITDKAELDLQLTGVDPDE